MSEPRPEDAPVTGHPEVDAALAGIGETLRQIYVRADALGISTAAAADALAEELLKAP